MASGGSKSAASVLLIVNLVLYFIVTVIAAWAVSHGIQRSRETASVLSIPARIFPIYFPFGNMATGFFVIFSLIAGVVGMATSLTGLNNVSQWNAPNLHAAAASSLATWGLTLLAMGLACKEIELGWTNSNLRTLETITIVVSATQTFCAGALHVGLGRA
ncbi:hypothetical protein F2P56_015587 [Juglans regia]|uniref:Membrane protein PM19L-like n=2 Tax=Juglans regia TaxID=51240 RepID=A0A833XGD1_JUGRE|nr:membrane protein PM19L-like [Juglans regia]KAF5465601.1 hypothetical protein F2P56_015587 [Juglans regia]